MKILAVTSAARVAALPDIPTIAEAGFPAGHAETWMGIVAPTGTSASVIEHLGTEIASIRGSAQFQARVIAFGLTPAQGSTEEFATSILADHKSWGQVVREAGVRIE